MKKLVIMLMIVTLVSNISVNATMIGFSDINNHWAKENIGKLVDRNIIDGYPDGTFKPDKPINVDAYIKLAVTALGYTDIQNAEGYWASNYINKALELTIIQEGQFDTYKRIITREEMASIMIKALDQIQEIESIEEKATFISRTIKDSASIAMKYQEDVFRCYYYGLITGKPNGFDPKGNATRAEASTVILRLLDETYRKPIYIPPTVGHDDIIKDEKGIYFDVVRYRDYKSADERIATEVDKEFRVYGSSKGEPTAIQLMYVMDTLYKDNEGYVYLDQLSYENNSSGVVYACLDNVEHSFDVVDSVNHSEVDFYIKHSKYKTKGAYHISLYYKKHNMTYMERYYKYQEMFETLLMYLYEDEYQNAIEKIIETLKISENMRVSEYNYTIKMNGREMYITMNQNQSVNIYMTIKGGEIEHYYPTEENPPDIPYLKETGVLE